MMLYDGLECSFRKVRLRKRQENCKVCGLNPEITHLIDYEQFCGRKADDKTPSLRLLDPEQRITVMVREYFQYEIDLFF